MSNKSEGTKFERKFAKILYQYGFWVAHWDGAVDLFAARRNIAYLFECKVCDMDYFNYDRVEDNQLDTIDSFRNCENYNHWFVFKVLDEIYLSKSIIKRPSDGYKFKDWVSLIDGLDR